MSVRPAAGFDQRREICAQRNEERNFACGMRNEFSLCGVVVLDRAGFSCDDSMA